MKNFARLLSLALVLVMALCLVGCGPKSKIKGEWKGEIMGITLTLEFDGKEMTMKMGGEEETVDYEFDGDKLLIDDEEVEYEFDGKDTLILDMDDLGEVEFERQ